MNEQAILGKLKGGDRRSIEHADRGVASVRRDPSLFPALMSDLRYVEELIRMRLADAAEKLTITSLHWLQPYKSRLMSLAARVEQQELRWRCVA